MRCGRRLYLLRDSKDGGVCCTASPLISIPDIYSIYIATGFCDDPLHSGGQVPGVTNGEHIHAGNPTPRHVQTALGLRKHTRRPERGRRRKLPPRRNIGRFQQKKTNRGSAPAGSASLLPAVSPNAHTTRPVRLPRRHKHARLARLGGWTGPTGCLPTNRTP